MRPVEAVEIEEEKFKRIEVKKLEAAERQLTTAIQLFFQDGDLVSIHTLAEASYQVLADIGRTQSPQVTLIKEEFEKGILPDRLKEFRKILSGPKNFFKHADNDPDPNGSIILPELATETVLHSACHGFFKITPRKRKEFFWLNAFCTWIEMYRSEWFLMPPERRKILHETMKKFPPENDRRSFIKEFKQFGWDLISEKLG